MFDISAEVLHAAAKIKYGEAAVASPPYSAAEDYVRCSIFIPSPKSGEPSISFGANFMFKEGVFQ